MLINTTIIYIYIYIDIDIYIYIYIAHQYSSDQKKILKDQGDQTTARVVSVPYRL